MRYIKLMLIFDINQLFLLLFTFGNVTFLFQNVGFVCGSHVS